MGSSVVRLVIVSLRIAVRVLVLVDMDVRASPVADQSPGDLLDGLVDVERKLLVAVPEGLEDLEQVRYGGDLEVRPLQEVVVREYPPEVPLRDLTRNALSTQEWQMSKGEVLAAMTIYYSSESSFATRRILEMQHRHYSEIRSSTHFHISETSCFEVLVVSGKAEKIKSLVKSLKSVKGILHADVMPISNLGRR